jgi:hypothetical protein
LRRLGHGDGERERDGRAEHRGRYVGRLEPDWHERPERWDGRADRWLRLEQRDDGDDGADDRRVGRDDGDGDDGDDCVDGAGHDGDVGA